MLAAIHSHSSVARHDAAFIALLDGFRASGGLARAEDLASQFRHRHADADLRLARWIAHGNAVSLRWAGAHWVPLFQLQGAELALHPALAPALGELRTVLNGWEVAQWFSTPNGWLHEAVPAEAFATRPADVLQAARSDRFALAG